VAAIWVEGNDNITAFQRSIVVYGRSGRSQTIRSYHACYDPLAYPLFHPNGELGWHENIMKEDNSQGTYDVYNLEICSIYFFYN
jgi:hypothetical protein